MTNHFLLILGLLISLQPYSQGCCSGGTTNPISGGAVTGVLRQNQFEVSTNHQYLFANKFYTQDRDTIGAFDHITSNYIFLRMDYGVSDKLTVSIASGYFINKSRIDVPEFNYSLDTIETHGFSDIIILPRYGVFNKSNGNKKTELTLGLGMKLPLGSHIDSTLQFENHPISGKAGYTINQPIAQTSFGSIDMMFYAFLFRSYNKQKLKIFSNFLHIRTGYNSIGQKFGDYSSLGFFVGKKVNKRIGITVQLRAERIGNANINKQITYSKIEYESHDLFNATVDPLSTGSFKTFFVPQLTYSKRNFTIYTTSEIPIYQYVNGTQVGSQFQLTTGINFRFQSKTPSYQVTEHG